jgi:hypothetical protein
MRILMADRTTEILEEMRADRAEWNLRLEEMRRDSTARFEQLQQESHQVSRFLAEMNRRAELVFGEVVRELREMRDEIRASTDKIEASTETTKAHTRAIFAVIDRLEGGGGAAPAT